MNGAIFYHYDLDPRNGSHSDAIDPAREEDVYRITVAGSGTLTVHSTGSTDVYGYLLSSSGSVLTSNDDGGQDRNFRISHSVSAGTYYVRVRHYSTTGTGDYEITSSFAGGSYYGSILNLNDSLKSSIDSAGEEDLYRVTVAESGTLTIYSTDVTDTYGTLLDSAWNELASNDDGGQSTNFRISHSVSAGTYYVRVRHYSTTGTGDYGITSSFTATSSSGGGSSGGGSGGSGSGSGSGSSSGGSSSGGVVGFSVSDWERTVVSAGTTHNSIMTTPVDTTTHPTHDLSGMAGATAATYEFVVNAMHTDQFSPILLGDNVWWLKFDQERVSSTQVNQLGVTRRGVEDYFFTSISGRSLASPYDRDAHIVYTYDGADTEVFVDGQQVGSLSGHGHIFTHAASELGWSPFLPDSQHNLKGRILAFASYRSVLPDREIQNHYNAAFPSGTQSPPAVPQPVPQPQPTLNPDGDEDNDGLTNAEETQLFAAYNLDPYNADSDGDGTNDGYEDFDSDQVTNIFELRTFHSDPLDAYSLDPNNQVTDSAWLFLAPLDSSSALQLARAWGQIQAGQSSSPTTSTLISDHETETSNGRASIRFTGTTVADGVTYLNFVFTPRNDAEETFDLYFRPGVSGTTYWAWIEVLPSGRTIAVPLFQFASPQGFFTGGSRADTDGDGLTDGFELLVSKTNPTNRDSAPDSAVDHDGDGQIDNFSGLANNGVYDSQEDFEPDNLRNEAEYYLGTNPFRSDSDDDGTNDSDEEPPIPPGALPGDGEEEEYDEQPFTGLSNGLHEYSGTVDLTGTPATPDDMAGVILEKTPEGNVILSNVKSTSSNQVEIAAKVIVQRPRERLSFTGAPYHPPTGQNGGKLPIEELRERYPYIANKSGSGRSVGNAFGTGLTQMNQSIIDTWDEEVLRYYAQTARSGANHHLSAVMRTNQRIQDALDAGEIPSPGLLRKLNNDRKALLIQTRRLTATHLALAKKGLVGTAIPYFGTGAVLFAVLGNSSNHAAEFEAAFRQYADGVQNNDWIDLEFGAQAIATACANLVGITQPVWSYVYDALSP